eukprot:TRINITY_DN2533_c0_g1_i6.p1 TRINITY_DN2533_c0_g1~~TRINITY_DN2533_c0_g1_i6.p1  ORF type:complete len:579 (-),score=112.53 TRINITY_DN2533_c0_g1_i6:168-1904(-)
MVDLPGMAKNPVGDQPKDIEKQILNLIKPYVQNPNSLILAISKANDDLATSEALKLARDVDPQGDRTVGVITQMDIMDAESDIMKDLQNQTYPLKLGYVGVMCRGETDKKKNVSIEEQIQKEQKFFQNHKVYSKFSKKMGIPYLQKTLNENFVMHIKQSLPNIKGNLLEMLSVKEFDMKQYGSGAVYESSEAQGLFILNLIQRFCQNLKELINGHYLKSMNDELMGGARIHYIFVEIYRKSINKIDPFDQISDEEIRVAISNSNGIQPSLFIPEGAFQNLLKQQLMRLQPLSIQCSQLIFDELRRLIYQINIPEIQRFEIFNAEIYNVMDQVLTKCLKPTQEMIKNLIEIELGYVNIHHPDFLGGSQALISILQKFNEDEKPKENANLPINEPKKGKKEESKKPSNENQQSKQPGGLFGWFSSKKEDIDAKLKQHTNIQIQSKVNNSEFNSNFFEENYSQQFPTQSLAQPPQNLYIESKPTQREIVEINTIKTLISSYFDVVKKNISDTIPKTIVTMLINQIKNIAERELITSLYQQEQFEKLLQENEFISMCRKDTFNQIKLLKNCLAALMSIDAKF